MDKRSIALGGESAWIRSNLSVFNKPAELKAHDWIQLVQCAGDYLFADVIPNDLHAEAIFALLDVCNELLNATYPADAPLGTADIEALNVRVAEALSKCESVLPTTELAVMFHILLHVPAAIRRWNSVRNFWSFFVERTMGYLIRHINNRDLAAENIMTAYVRLRYLLWRAPASIGPLRERLAAVRFALPPESMVMAATNYTAADVAGEFALRVKLSRRNSRLRKNDDFVPCHLETLMPPRVHGDDDYHPDFRSTYLMNAGVTMNGRR